MLGQYRNCNPKFQKSIHSNRFQNKKTKSPSATHAPINIFPAIELTESRIESTINDFVNTSILARQAGYDGVEIMGSEGYLIHQFILQKTNLRFEKKKKEKMKTKCPNFF